ncbi:hypothetical protein NA57DRAFT_79948 [Rhizodiscina lignyota]|uniref:ORC6 first cyclin-like domain-containing protein n=1 Tax=Rhizodiscina lignyota TaxID=1504668 RepID=A0A9P4M6F2_9PEZI|nr:hypothetical protein NA57DRAFT_79948 [Rhizodiscina lignyota]
MNREIEKALTTIIPSLSALPLELVDLAVSLLAQSRSKASALKPDEEIARSYICAHIACERSKQKLNLPPITPRPPCAPRVYKKLYTYLDSALSSRPTRPSAHRAASLERRDSDINVSTPSRTRKSALTTPTGTPTKRSSVAVDRYGTPTPRRTTKPTTGSGLGEDGIAQHLPLVRAICIALDHRLSIPHVVAGVRSILKAHGESKQSTTPSRPGVRTRRSGADQLNETPISEDEIPALIIIVMVMAVGRLSGEDVNDAYVAEKAQAAVDSLSASNSDVAQKFNVDMVVLTKNVADLTRRAEQGWLDMEWFCNIEEPGADSDHRHSQGDMLKTANVEDDELLPISSSRRASRTSKKRKRDEYPAEPFLQPGLGTMFCDAVDWLSEDRKSRYQIWKREIMAKLESAA